MLYAFGDHQPQIHPTAFVAPTATLIGDVVIEAYASVWFGAVLRGDNGRIVIGENSNVQDNAVLHEATVIGKGCTIAHLVLAHGIEVEDNVLIGNGATVFGGSHIGEGSLIGAGAVVAPGTHLEPHSLALGAPAKRVRETRGRDRELILHTAEIYRNLRERYLRELRPASDS